MPVSTKNGTPRRKSSTLHARDTRQLTDLALRACRVASDAAFNLRDFLTNSSRMAFLSVRDCEQELDRIEREIDEQLPAAITQVSEPEARELLACLRFSTDLERIGDLLLSVGHRVHNLQTRLSKADAEQLTEMVEVLEKMLGWIQESFTQRELESAGRVLQTDHEIDQVYKSLFRRHVESRSQNKKQPNTDVILMAQALERAGDHATNLAEELFRLIEGRSLRHIPKKRMKD
jgi:phosphate transport system protein